MGDRSACSPAAVADSPAGWRLRGPVLTVTTVVVMFFAPALLPTLQFVSRDTGREHTPMKQWIADELTHGRLPEWNPYTGIGEPVIANGVDAVLHPFSALLLALPTNAALKAWILLSCLFAALGVLAWTRVLGRSAVGATIGAIVFALSGPIVSSTDNITPLTAYATLPWVFAAAQYYARRRSPIRLLLVAVSSALVVAAGDPMSWAFAVGLLPVITALAAFPEERRRAVFSGLAASAASLVVAAPIILPIALQSIHSSRAAGLEVGGVNIWNLHPLRLPELLLPELYRGETGAVVSPVFQAYCGNEYTRIPWYLSIYVGATAFALALLGGLRERRTRVLLILAILFTWAALGPYAGFAHFASHVPVLNSFRYWEKLTAWVALLVAMAAAVGAEAFLARQGSRRFTWGVGMAAVLAAGIAGLVSLWPSIVGAVLGGAHAEASGLAESLVRGAGQTAAFLGALAVLGLINLRGNFARVAPLALGAVITLDLIGGNARAYVLGPPQRTVRPALAIALDGMPDGRVLAPFLARLDRWPELGTIGSYWEWGRRTFSPAWNVPLRIGSPDEYVPLPGARWKRVRAAAGNGEKVGALGLFGFGYVVVPGRPENIQTLGFEPPWRIIGSDPEMPAYLLEVAHRPRVYLAQALVEVNEAAALAFAIRGGEPGRTVTEAPVPPGYVAPAGQAHIAVDRPGDTEVDVTTTGPSLLVLNDLFEAGWTATVDGRSTPMVRTNYVARGVWVDAGHHRVRFRYRTPGLRFGLAIMLTGVSLLLAWALARSRTGLNGFLDGQKGACP